MVIWPADFLTVVHERVEVREVAVQVHSVSVVSSCQVPIAVWALQGKAHHGGEYRVGAGRLAVGAAETGCCNGTSVPLNHNMHVIAGRRVKGIVTDRESQ